MSTFHVYTQALFGDPCLTAAWSSSTALACVVGDRRAAAAALRSLVLRSAAALVGTAEPSLVFDAPVTSSLPTPTPGASNSVGAVPLPRINLVTFNNFQSYKVPLPPINLVTFKR